MTATELDPMVHIRTLNAHVSVLTEEVLLLRTHVAVLQARLEEVPEAEPGSEK